MNFCPKCRKKLVVQDFCVECGADLSEFLNNDSSNDSLGAFDFSVLQDANEKLIAQSGLVIENGVLTGYTGKKTSVVIPSSVEEIFERAFYNNSFITDVEIGNGVSAIGKSAFAHCRYLKRVKIPKSVKQIGEYAFYATQLDYLMLDEYNLSILTPCLSANAIKYLNTGADIKPVIKEENGSLVISIRELEAKATEYFNELKRKEEEERRRQQEEARRKYELLMADIGKVWTFGSYYINSGSIKDPIEWIVLERHENKALLISKYALAYKKFNETNVSCWWTTCTLRKWLNEDFLNSAFSASEKERILTLKNVRGGCRCFEDYRLDEDKVFILAEYEARKYFKTNSERVCELIPYEKNKCGGNYYPGSWLCARVLNDGGIFSNHDYRVEWAIHGDGRVYKNYNTAFCVTMDCCVRPAIWISM